MSVLIFLENWDGKFKKMSFELVSYASKVAEMLGDEAIALSIGKVETSELEKLSTYGAAKIVSINNETTTTFDDQLYTSVIAETTLLTNADVVVFPNNTRGKALASRLSVRIKAGSVTGVNQLPISLNPFVVSKKVFSGKAFAHVQIKTRLKIITLAQNSFGVFELPKPFVHEMLAIQLNDNLVKTHIKQEIKHTGKVLINDADIVVSGGRGMKSPDNWGPLVELAELLGAATACSRPVSDEGWRSHEEHTGQTGKIISPNLYFAIGISGATQHLAGINSSKVIVAINTDKDAPIFEAAQYGIVGDAMKVLPLMVSAVKEIKAK